MVTRKGTRNSSIELLKVIAILMIVCSHVVQTLGSASDAVPFQDYVLNLSTATLDTQRLLLTMLRYSGALGNTIFFICSAWFLLDSERTNREKIASLMADIWVISVMILVIVFIAQRGDIPANYVVKSFFPTLFANNWYMTCYILFYAIHPILNRIIKSMKQTELLRCALFMGILYIGLNYINGFFFPSALTLWVSIYFLMAYMKQYMPKMMDKISFNMITLAVGIIGNYGIIMMTNYLGLRSATFENELLRWNNNCSPFLIMIAISLFNIARQIHFRNRLVNLISQMSFLIYIVHENLLLRTYYRPMMWQYIYENYGYAHIIAWVGLMVIGLFAFGFTASVAYHYTIRGMVKKAARKMMQLLDRGYGMLEKLIFRLQ